MAHVTLFTTGYSGFKGDDFVWKLNHHSISVVVDVRASAASRNRAFAKSNLMALLADDGIEYVHFPSLGVPADLRKRLRNGEKLSCYFGEYHQHLEGQHDALEDLYKLVTRGGCCLLCLESKAEECHRSELAKALVQHNGNQLEIEHI